ncbi:hypothetical protein [Nitrosomonas communis]|uniref:Uncharacterized protein n=1 Tax=Nitrosomonas communis TaxID=44574 RepID=A0A1I4VT73_9PROT|nr:hypothetical protein [Nitrosomonas communis]SFN04383.1 hypothetical protein SAMN05421863_10904 [Nitrosomonas communis]
MSFPVVKWAVYPWDVDKVLYVDELYDPSHSPYSLPGVGDFIIRSFIVDPETFEPTLVRVVEIQEHPEMQPYTFVVVVIPASPNH